MDRIKANPLPFFKLFVRAIGLVAVAAMTIECASAHDKGCDDNPVPAMIKLNCCGSADEHQLKPEQISRAPNGEYIVSVEDHRFVIPADKALPSNDHCSHIYFEDGDLWEVPGTPNVYCFLTPLDF
jgi:hypothetical protein